MNEPVTHPLVAAARIVGGQAKLADLLGIQPQNLTQWMRGKRPIPILRCVEIERFTAGRITREALRPDLDWAEIMRPYTHERA